MFRKNYECNVKKVNKGNKCGQKKDIEITENKILNSKDKKMTQKEKNEKLCVMYQKRGDRKALENIIMINIDIIESCIKKLFQKEDWMFDMKDYIQCGYIGMMKAVLSYEKKNHNSFRNYAAKCINNELKEEIIDIGAKSRSQYHNEEVVLKEQLPNVYDIVERKLLNESIDRVLNTLKSQEKMIMEMRCGFGEYKPMTLSEIGRELRLTRERIRQIEAKAIRRLRHPSRSRKLKDYWR